MLSIIERYANYIVPVLTVFASYIVGRLQSRRDKDTAALKEAYEKLYVPFIRLLYTQKLCNLPFSALPTSDQMKIYNLFMDNLQYMDEKALYTMQPFCYEFTFLVAQRSGAIEGRKFAAENTDGIFNEAVQQILNRAIVIAKKLHLPPIAKVVLDDYLESKASREKALKELK